MYTSRIAFRASRAAQRQALRASRQKRFQSTGSSTSGSAASNPAITGGVAGGATALVGGYLWYHFSGAKTIVQTSKEVKSYIESAKNKVKESSPEPNEALQWLRQTATSYAAYFPGASQYVDTAFNDLDSIRAKHGQEVDRIVKEAYEELRGVSSQKFSMQTAQQAWEIIQKHLKRIADLAGDAAEDILNNHPDLKNKIGGSFDQLKSLGDQLGPEAKKQVDQTWEQISDVLKTGVNATSVTKIRKIIQEKIDAVKKLRDEAWQKGLEQAKPYLDKNPKIKELLEENKSQLVQGNVQELWNKVRSAADSGNTAELQSYIRSATDKTKQQGFGRLDQYLKAVPYGDEILPKLQQLSELTQTHGKEAEQLLEATVDDIKQVLSKRSQQAEDLANKASK